MTKEHKKNTKHNDAQSEEAVKEIKDVEEEIIVEQGQQLEELQKKAAEYLDGWQRCQAEFENYRKRQSEAQKDLTRYAAQNVVMQLIPVLDNFHMSTAHVPEDQQANPWVVGIMHIQKQLEQVLLENGVEEIVAREGDNFDPALHEAVADKECKNCVDCQCEAKYQNKIKKVLQKGYRMGERVIRPARVVVE